MTTDDSTADRRSFYHVCFAVPDLSSAMNELTGMVGLAWDEPQHLSLGDWPYSLVFSRQFPHIELISSVEGSPWHTAQPIFHHLGWWAGCLGTTQQRWHDAGGLDYFDGRDHGRSFLYTDAPASGARLEAVDIAQRAGFLRRWTEQQHTPSVE